MEPVTRKITALTEDVFGGAPQVDAEQGVIRGVKILGRESRNGRIYSDQALAEAARHYEGAQVNLNHPGKKEPTAERPFESGIGWLESVAIHPDGVRGNLHYLKSHPYAPALVEAAQRNPKRFGLSHNAEGTMSRIGGKNVVESVHKVHSVDLVQNPATVAGLFESEDPQLTDPPAEKPVKIKLKEYVSKIPASHKLQPVLAKLLEDDMTGDAGSYDMPEAAPMPGGDQDADSQIDSAFEAMVCAVLDDDSLDVAAKVKRIKDILTAQDKLMNPAPADKPADSPQTDGTSVAAESEQKARAKHAEELLEAAGIKADPAKVKALAALTESTDRKALIESWKPAPVAPEKAKKPARSVPAHLQEGAAYPGDYKSFLRSIGAKPATTV